MYMMIITLLLYGLYGQNPLYSMDNNQTSPVLKNISNFECGVIIFGDLSRKSITDIDLPFISTYSLNVPLLFGVAINCDIPENASSHSQIKKNKYIFIQNPTYDQFPDKESPYQLRPHPACMSSTFEVNTMIPCEVHLKETTNLDEEGTFFDVSLFEPTINGELKENNKIRITQRESGEITFCPNNLWISGLPQRGLINKEVFSFISVCVFETFEVETLHLLCAEMKEIYKLAEENPDTASFLENIINSHIFENLHLEKLQRFIDSFPHSSQSF